MKRRIVVVALSLIVFSVSLFSADLDDIIREAKGLSSTMRLIELGRGRDELSMASKDLKNKIGVSVNDSLTFTESRTTNRYTLSGNPTVSLALPNDGGTQIKFSAPFSTTLQGDWVWNASPNIGISHTFKLGDSGKTLDDLGTTRQRLSLDRSYAQQILDFENSIYSKIVELLGYESNLLKSEADLLSAQTRLDNAIRLKTVTVGTTAHQNMELSLKQLQNSRRGMEERLALSKIQYKQLTGLEWEGVGNIREVALEFSPLTTGDTTVLLAAIDEEIARENLATEQRRLSNSSSVSSLSVGGDIGFGYNQGATSTTTSYTITPRATYSGNNFSVGSTVNLSIDGESGKLTPTVTVSGGWQNSAAREREELNLRDLEQRLEIAILSHQDARFTYQLRVNQMEGDLLNFALEREQFKANRNYRQEVLEKTVEAFNRGLATQSEVDQARLNVELDRFEEQRYALQALILANRIEALKL